MAEEFKYQSEIQQGEIVQSWHVSQSVDAFTGEDAYDITISGSSTLTGSMYIVNTIRTWDDLLGCITRDDLGVLGYESLD